MSSSKTATFSMRMTPQKKQEMEEFFEDLGLTTATAVNIFFEHSIMAAGIPFDVKADGEIPNMEEWKSHQQEPMKTAQFSMRIDPYKKAQVEYTFKTCGLSVSDAVNVFFEACLRTCGFPFRVGYPRPNEETAAAMKEAEDMLSGKIPAKRYASWKEAKADIFTDDDGGEQRG